MNTKRFLEMLLLYIGTPLALLHIPALAKRLWGVRLGMWVIPSIIAIALVVYLVEMVHGHLKVADLFRADVPVREWGRMLLRFALFAGVLTALLWWKDPSLLFAFPRRNPKFWAMVMVCYPVLSVIPQGLLYRWFFEHRYAALLPRRASWLVGALLFSFAHILFRNPYALAFTFVGGLFFLGSYRKTGSVLFSNVEHTLFGDFLFTIGWGAYFFEGTQRMVQAAVGG